ncbi:MAG TPA: hypothetical protein VG650_16045 [Mycobacteriales bacterium]|nr:hypothetical protein [Mycobacteriales bacterium]
MSLCPRCGTGLQISATVCTACCYVLDIGGANESPAEPARPDVGGATPARANPDVLPVAIVPEPEPATAGLGNGLGIPTQRSAAFKPLRISTTPPPPNPYLAAERRLQARYRAALAEQRRSHPDAVEN